MEILPIINQAHSIRFEASLTNWSHSSENSLSNSRLWLFLSGFLMETDKGDWALRSKCCFFLHKQNYQRPCLGEQKAFREHDVLLSCKVQSCTWQMAGTSKAGVTLIKRMAHWERWEIAVPFGNKQAEKSKVICWTCARVNRMERWLHCIYRKRGQTSCHLVQK